MQIIYPILFILIALKFAKWRNFNTYYPTVLFMVIGNLLYSYLFKEYPLWRFEHTFEENLLPTRLSINLIKIFISFPSLTVLFLSYYPDGKSLPKKGLYVVFWALLFGAVEFISKKLGMISYHHGWNIWWSLLFDLMMFIILAIHYKRPISAWALSAIFIIFLWNVFHINFEMLE